MTQKSWQNIHTSEIVNDWQSNRIPLELVLQWYPETTEADWTPVEMDDVPVASDLPVVYADIVVTGDIKTGIPRLKNSGSDKVHVRAVLRASEDCNNTDNILTMVSGDYGFWNIQLREATETQHDVIIPHPNDPIYDIFEAQFVDGVCEFDYVTTNKPAYIYMREADFARIVNPLTQTEYQVQLIRPVRVKVYRKLG